MSPSSHALRPLRPLAATRASVIVVAELCLSTLPPLKASTNQGTPAETKEIGESMNDISKAKHNMMGMRKPGILTVHHNTMSC